MHHSKPKLDKGKSPFQHDSREKTDDQQNDHVNRKLPERGVREPDDGGESTLSGQPRETEGKRDDAPHLER